MPSQRIIVSNICMKIVIKFYRAQDSVLCCSDQPKGFRPKPKELILKREISAESRNGQKEIVSAERGTFGRKMVISAEYHSFGTLFRPKFMARRQMFRPKYPLSAEMSTFGRNCLFRSISAFGRNISAIFSGLNFGRNRNFAPFG